MAKYNKEITLKLRVGDMLSIIIALGDSIKYNEKAGYKAIAKDNERLQTQLRAIAKQQGAYS
jgi:hypothetical protein